MVHFLTLGRGHVASPRGMRRATQAMDQFLGRYTICHRILRHCLPQADFSGYFALRNQGDDSKDTNAAERNATNERRFTKVKNLFAHSVS